MNNNKEEKTSSLDVYIKEVWKDYRDGFEEDAAKEVGIVVEDYVRHPDTGLILADNSYSYSLTIKIDSLKCNNS